MQVLTEQDLQLSVELRNVDWVLIPSNNAVRHTAKNKTLAFNNLIAKTV